MRYLRAFSKALVLTLRGETIQSPAQQQFPALFAWRQQAMTAWGGVTSAADTNGYDLPKRKNVTVRVDGRDTSMETILNTVQFHLGEEYLYLLNHPTDHTLTALYATNMNDQYAVATLSQSPEIEGQLADAIANLADVLKNIPQSNEP